MQEKIAVLDAKIQSISASTTSLYAAPEVDRQDKGTTTDTTPPPFSLGQALYPSKSPIWSIPAPFWVAYLEVTLETAGGTTSVVDLLKNGGRIARITLAAGQTRNMIRVGGDGQFGVGFTPQDTGGMEIVVAGDDAANLAVVLRGAMIQDSNS